MEKIKDLETILQNAVKECCKSVDCDTIAAVFECADWRWVDYVTGNEYCPTAREIRQEFFRLGKDALQSFIANYEKAQTEEDVRPYTIATGRLYFSIELEQAGEELNVLNDVSLSCGFESEASCTTIDDVTDNDYTIMTYTEDSDYSSKFKRKI